MYRYPDLNSEKIHIVIIVVEKLHWEERSLGNADQGKPCVIAFQL